MSFKCQCINITIMPFINILPKIVNIIYPALLVALKPLKPL